MIFNHLVVLLVPGPGIAPTVFETVASTDSAIRADGGGIAWGKVTKFFLFLARGGNYFIWGILGKVSPGGDVVVVDFDAEDDGGGDGGDGVGDDEWDVDGFAVEALDYEEDRAEAHEEEGGKGDGVGVACADGVDGLGEVAEYHADGGEGAEDFK